MFTYNLCVGWPPGPYFFDWQKSKQKNQQFGNSHNQNFLKKLLESKI